MSRAVTHDTFGGPEVLELRDVAEPHAGPDEVRVRVAAAGLNPMDWVLSSMPEMADMLGYSVPSGFGHDFAGFIDEVGDDIGSFAVGDRVFGGALGRAVADYVIVNPATDILLHTPEGVTDEIASALPVSGLTADAALHKIGLKDSDTVLIGGAGGGVGVIAVQLARLMGARVIGTGSESSFQFLRQLGAEPVAYGPGLSDRIRKIAPDGVTAATSLVGTETVDAALELGVPPERISTISAGPNPRGGVQPTGGVDATPGALERIAQAIAAGTLTVPIAATYPIEQIRDAVILQKNGHVHGKVVVTL